MSGYVPVFGSVFTGTLHGKWPDVGLWLCILGMADRNGIVDCTPQYIASVTGLQLADVEGCIQRFMEPDKYSRTQTDDGRRLVLVDPSRSWGWKIVNHGKYREKARLQSRDKDRTESGADAARKAASRGDVPRSPPVSPALPPSDSDIDLNKDKDKTPLPPKGEVVQGLDLKAWEAWTSYRSAIRKPLKQASIPAAQRKLAAFGSDQAAAVENAIANGYMGIFPVDKAAAKPKPQGPIPREFGT